MSAVDTHTPKLSRRTIAAGLIVYHDVGGRPRFPSLGDDVDLTPGEERRLENAGALLPNRRPQMGLASAVRPSAADTIALAKRELERGRPARARRVLDAERIEPREARAEVVDELLRLLALSRAQTSGSSDQPARPLTRAEELGVSFQADPPATVAPHLAPLDPEHRAQKAKVDAAASQGWRAWEAAEAKYKEWLNSQAARPPSGGWSLTSFVNGE